jgi:hypothetical protein
MADFADRHRMLVETTYCFSGWADPIPDECPAIPRNVLPLDGD